MTPAESPPLVIANWKMNLSEAQALVALPTLVSGSERLAGLVRMAVAPPFPWLRAVGERLASTPLWLGAQNTHWEDRGAFTGEVSPPMLVELGVRIVLVGHSERRHLFGETDDWIGRKVAACVRHDLIPVVCVGETESERDAGRTAEVVSRQVAAAFHRVATEPTTGVVIAYEPVWAIGTGRNATPDQVQEVHALIRAMLGAGDGARAARNSPILYGESVTPENAPHLLALEEVDGALVGGASLDPGRFLAIANAAA